MSKVKKCAFILLVGVAILNGWSIDEKDGIAPPSISATL